MSIAQSYKVFIGSSFIQFGNEPKNTTVFNSQINNPSVKNLTELIADLETNRQQAILITGDSAQNWKSFCSIFKIVEAAGGFVQNEQGEWLFIFRNGMWDLPKGKLEKAEEIEDCAVREVSEECGIAPPEIRKALNTTYHTYNLNGTRILKPTYWYLMSSADKSELIPQTEEGISEVIWVDSSKAIELAKGSFGSIKQVIEQVIK